MESYLSGRGNESSSNSGNSVPEFRTLSEIVTRNPDNEAEKKAEKDNATSTQEVIYSDGDSPVVEVMSVDGCPREIIVHMNDGRLLKISCNY